MGDSGGLIEFATMVALNPSAAFTQANSIMLTIENILTAVTGTAGETAFIQKKFSIVATTAVPLPAAAWLFGSALGLFGLIRRRSA